MRPSPFAACLSASTLLAGVLLAVVAPPADAATVRVSYRHGVLTIKGTGKADTITVTRKGKYVAVRVAGHRVKVRPKIIVRDLAAIRVRGRGGNDRITLVELDGRLPGAVLSGGSGDDALTGGSGVTRLLGREGNDYLTAGSGATTLNGGAGNDKLVGSTGTLTFNAGPGNDDVVGSQSITSGDLGDGADLFVGAGGAVDVRGGAGDDTYQLKGGISPGAMTLREGKIGADGTDTISFADIALYGVTLDLGTTSVQQVTPDLNVTLESPAAFENVVGSIRADTLTGNILANRFTGLLSPDVFVHRGANGSVDTVTDMDPNDEDQVRFETGGALTADALTLNATASQLRDVATGTFGFDFTVPVLDDINYYVFGSTDTAPAGQLMTDIAGGFGQEPIVDRDSLIASFAFPSVATGVLIGGAAGRDRIIDHSPSGSSFLRGGDGQDVLIGGDGADSLWGDGGLAPGVSDTYTGGTGADMFVFGEALGGGFPETFGADTITDFGSARTRPTCSPGSRCVPASGPRP